MSGLLSGVYGDVGLAIRLRRMLKSRELGDGVDGEGGCVVTWVRVWISDETGTLGCWERRRARFLYVGFWLLRASLCLAKFSLSPGL